MGTEIYVDQMFNYTSAVTAETQMNAGTTSSQGTYSPQANGTLVKIGIIVTPQAATSLCQQFYIKLTCTAWTPVNTLIIPAAGFGLATAPQAIGGNELLDEHIVNLPVNTALPIKGYVQEFWSAITPNVIVRGTFTA